LKNTSQEAALRRGSMAERVTLRSTKAGLLVVLDDEGDFLHIRALLDERLQASGDLFSGLDVTVDLGDRRILPRELKALEDLVSSHGGMRLVRVVHGGQRSRAEEGKGTTLLRSGPVKAFAEDGPSLPGGRDLPTLLVRGTVRSGQEVRNEGNVVIVGDVNPGAEVIATGDIVVLGSLRGVAHAGASGDATSIVAAVSLRPIQLRIAEHVGRPPDGEDLPSGPELARVQDGRIVVENYSGASRGGDGVWGRPW
jgi:septum site-determining protein MinC